MKGLLYALALILPTLVQAETATVPVQTAAGQVEAPANPAKVVAFDVAAIDTLSALEVPLAGRPGIEMPGYLPAAISEVATVGTLFEPDFEALAVMGPDLIIAGGRSQAQVAALSKLAPTLDMTIDGADLRKEAEARIDAYAAIFDKADKAEALKAQLTEAEARAREAAKDKGNALILLTNGGKISAYGANSRFGWMHNILGLAEARPGLSSGNHGEAVSFEFVAEVNPDWILVVDRGATVGQGGESAASTLDNPLIKGTTAGQKDQIIYLNGGAVYLAAGGVGSMLFSLDQLTEAFKGAKS